MRLGPVLRELRERRGKTQMDVVKRLKISQTYLSQVETGKKNPSQEMLRKLGGLYKLPASIILYLATEEEDVQKRKQPIFRELKPTIDSMIEELLK